MATAAAWQMRDRPDGRQLLETTVAWTPHGDTRAGLEAALANYTMSIADAAKLLGNGSRVISSDTVPFSLFSASHHLSDFSAAMWSTVSALGDRDTTCAIAGGVVAMTSQPPADWLASREPLRHTTR